MDPVIHFEIPAVDRNKLSDFYSKVFGWKMKQYGPQMGNYILTTTADSDENNVPKIRGEINGGFFTKTDQDHSIKITIRVDDIEEAMKKIKQAGGIIIGGTKPGVPEHTPGLGTFVNIQDVEGNIISLMQPENK